MKFKYIILDSEGLLKGTNSESVAKNFSDYGYPVFDVMTGKSLDPELANDVVEAEGMT